MSEPPGTLPIFTKSEPFHAQTNCELAGIVTPVVAEPLSTTAASDWLMTMYALLCDGAMMLRILEKANESLEKNAVVAL